MLGAVVTSFLVAIDFSKKGDVAKAVVVGLPLLTGLFATLISQFHLQDLWRLREIGHVEAMILREKVKALPTAVDDVEMRTALLPYELEKHELMRRQAMVFFEYLPPQKATGQHESE